MVSFETDCLRAASTASARRGFISASGTPIFAATVISRTSLVVILARRLAVTSFFECNHWRPIARSSSSGLPQRPHDQVLEREVAALADARDEQVVVVADQAELVEARHAAADLHREHEQVARGAAAVDLDLR